MPVVAWTDVYPDGAGSAAAGGAAGGGPEINPDFPGMPVGASPIFRDLRLTAATPAAGTDVWVPSVGNKFVLASAFISTDAAGVVSLIDDIDVQGQRPVVGRFAANGGASPNMVPVPYPSKAAGNHLRVVSTVVGNVDIRVAGWETT